MQLIVPLYELRDYDQSDPRWSPVFHYESYTGDAASPNVGTPISPPTGKAWIITSSFLQASPAAGVTAAAGRLRVAPVGGTAILSEPHGVRPFGQGAAETILGSQQTNFVLIGGVHQVNAIFTYDAGNAGNVQVWSIAGYEIPRGNVTLR